MVLILAYKNRANIVEMKEWKNKKREKFKNLVVF